MHVLKDAAETEQEAFKAKFGLDARVDADREALIAANATNAEAEIEDAALSREPILTKVTVAEVSTACRGWRRRSCGGALVEAEHGGRVSKTAMALLCGCCGRSKQAGKMQRYDRLHKWSEGVKRLPSGAKAPMFIEALLHD